MGGQGQEDNELELLDESVEITPDQTYDPAGTVDALSLDELDELERAGYAEDAEAAVNAADPQAGDSDA